jgi:hypothetical protein
MKKNHKTLYMILAVLLISFLFFGSRKEEVVEGFQEGFNPMDMLKVLEKGKKCRDKEANEGWEKIFTAWGTSEGAVKEILGKAEQHACKMTPNEGNTIASIITTAVAGVKVVADRYENEGAGGGGGHGGHGRGGGHK